MNYLFLLCLLVLFGCQSPGKDKNSMSLKEKLQLAQAEYNADKSNPDLKKDYIASLVSYGDSLKKAGDITNAFRKAADAFKLDSTNYDARLFYADVLNNRPSRSFEDIAAAQRHYKWLIKKKPKSTQALVGMASTFAQQMNFEQAFQYLNQALRIDPKFRDAYVMKGSIYRFMGKPELAKSSYETAVQQDPTFYEGYLMLGALYEAESNPIAIEYYRTAVQLKPKPEVMFSLAYAYQVFEQPGRAMSLYRRMIKLDTGYYQALNQIGVIKQYNYKQLDSAIYYYESAIKSKEDFVEAWHNLGMCYEEKKDLTRAMQSYAKALKYNPDFALSRQRADVLKYER